MSVDVIRVPAFGTLPHGFLGRRGGISNGAVAGLNAGLGSHDDAAAVAENRRRALAAVAPGAALVGVWQVHGPTVVTVREPWGDDVRPQADALVTDRPAMALGIVTADCAPVLFADLEAGVIGAAHAGWKGALGGVTDATLDAMAALGARRSHIVAAIGPCIARASYEVDAAFRQYFTRADPANARFFGDGRAGHAQFDLEAYVAQRLIRAGVGQVVEFGLDTYTDTSRFFSFRRATHAGEADYGRQLSIIALG